MTARLEGEIWLVGDEEGTLALEQIRLLQAIEETGSISSAAKQLGISYKTAWDRVERLNNLSQEPLVLRAAGGSKGGGTLLTEQGKRILRGFQELQEDHRQFLERVGARVHSFEDLSRFIHGARLNTSARNQLMGIVTDVHKGAVNAEVTLRVSENISITATVTEQSRKELGIVRGARFYALIKASSVMLSTGSPPAVSARNVLCGRVARVSRGKVSADVMLDLGDAKTLSALITNSSVDRLALETGTDACALFKASSVILLRA